MAHSFNAERLVREFIDPSVQDKLVRILRHLGQDQDADFMEHFIVNTARVYEANRRAVGSGIFDINDIKAEHETRKDVYEHLKGLQPCLVAFKPFTSLTKPHNSPYVTRLLARMDNDRYALSECLAEGTRFDVGQMKRVHNDVMTYKITERASGAYADFRAFSKEGDSFLPLQMLHIPPRLQRNYFTTRRILKGIIDQLISWDDDIAGLQSLCLTTAKGAPPVHQNDWRFEMVGAHSRLEMMYLRLGMILPVEDDRHRLYFLKYDEAMKLIREVGAKDCRSLYKYMCRSLYDVNQEASLKAAMATIT
jgi:hypothetical protein